MPQTPREWAAETVNHYAPNLIALAHPEGPPLYLDHDEARAVRDRLSELLGEPRGIPIVDPLALYDAEASNLDDLIVPRTDVIPAADTFRISYEAAEREGGD